MFRNLRLIQNLAFLTTIFAATFTVPSLSLAQETNDLLRLGVKSCQTFPVDEKTFITAKHCLMNLIPDDFKISHENTKIPINRVNRVEGHDYAILEAGAAVSKFYEKGEYKKGTDTYLVSSTGIQKVEVLEVPFEGKTFFLHSGITVSGSSGSPLIQNGKVVGLHIGVLETDGAKSAVFLPFNRLADAASLKGAEKQAVPAVLVAVWGACISSPQAATMCAAIISASAALTFKGIDVVIAYINALPDAKTAELQGALQQCLDSKEQIVNELKEEFAEARKEKLQNTVVKKEGNSGGGTATLPSDIGVVDPDLIELRSVDGGEEHYIAKMIGGRWVYYRVQTLSSVTAEFMALARVAFLHKFLSETGRLPTYTEASRGGGLLLSGASMDTIYRTAITPPTRPVTPPPRGCVEKGCPIEH